MNAFYGLITFWQHPAGENLLLAAYVECSLPNRKPSISGIPINSGILMKRSNPITAQNTYRGSVLSQIIPVR